MYTVNVRDHFMIAHSFRGEAFGPAQRLHGATYVVDAAFRRRALDADGMVVDIARATDVLRQVLAEFNFRNLDDEAPFAGQNTTTEFMARVVFERIAARAAVGELGPHASGLDSLRVRLHESHVAWAEYEGLLGGAALSDPQATRRCVFLVPNDWHSRTGGTLYDRRIVQGLQAAGWDVALRSPGDGFPLLDAATLAQAGRVVQALPDGGLVVADGLAFGMLPELAGQHAGRLRWVALVHHPLALETGLSPAQQAALHDSERRALRHARQVIVTSASTAHALAAFDVPPSRIAVVEPGTDPAPTAIGGGAGPGRMSLLCVASVTPRKGHAQLVAALAGLRDRPWQLHCAGSLERDPATVSMVRDAVAAHGLQDRIVWHGEIDAARLQELYAQADAFVLPSLHEGYGMALAEALARGLPVVSCAAGAIVDTVPAQAGLLVPPGDAVALRAALQRLLDEPALRAQLAAGAMAARANLPTWPAAVARFANVLERVR